MRARSLLLTGPAQVAWTETDLPEIGPHEVLVETLAGAISVGTELPHYLGTSRGFTHRYPAMTGYESVARVRQCGVSVESLESGDRIVSFYGHRTHAVIPANRAIRVPDGISDEIAILAILSCDVAKGVRKLNPPPSDPVLVTGAGAIGLLTLWVLQQYGVESVDLVEPQSDRRELARHMGARHVFDPSNPGAIGSDYAFGIECSSRDAAFALLQRSVRLDGAICILADGNLEPLTLTSDFHRKELHVVGSSDGWDYQAHAAWFFARPTDTLTSLGDLFQWRVTVDQLEQTFQRLVTADVWPVKVFVRYHE